MTRRDASHSASPTTSAPVIGAGLSYGAVTDRIVGIPLRRPTWRWLSLFGFGLSITLILLLAIFWVLYFAVGVWGIDIPVAWGFAIINFVWWIGIGHAGTLISAILLLLRQSWRNSINRLAEAMTLFAVANAGLFPLLHLGRPWKFYYLFPYPNTLGMWPQWRSPLVWDVFAVTTYLTVSLLFWYVGLVPDLASLRDTARKPWQRRLAGIFALGWRGAAQHWQRFQMLYLLLAGLATPLVVSVHSIVSLDFATSTLPGWHTTVFPPYFVAGAIFSGFAMVIVITVPLRHVFGFKDLITERHLDNMGKIMLVSGLIVAYGYIMEHFIAWYSGERYEIFTFINRALGPYAAAYWTTMTCNVVAPQFLWSRWVRTTPLALFGVALFINLGMWTERYMIVITSLHRDYMPSAWGIYVATPWDWLLFVGTLGFFLTMMLLFVRFVPMISAFETRELLYHHGPNDVTDPERDAATEAERHATRGVADDKLYGLTAEFLTPEQLTEAARRSREEGYTKVEAYSPFPLDGLNDALRLRPTRLPAIVLIGAILGAGSIYFVQWYSAVIDYPWNIGGRPLHSWQSFVPLTFEVGILLAAIFGVVGMFARNGLPRPYHPIFNAPGFDRASRDRFFLCIEKADPKFDRDRTGRWLASLQPQRVAAVPT